MTAEQQAFNSCPIFYFQNTENKFCKYWNWDESNPASILYCSRK